MSTPSGDGVFGSESFQRLQIWASGDPFFDALESAINAASSSVDFEMYIFMLDRTGERIFQALVRAVRRGVRVRMVVDGIGSTPYTRTLHTRARQEGILCKVYHELPWERWMRGASTTRRAPAWKQFLRRLNSRNHRKVCIVDGKAAFLGSMNVCDAHLGSLVGAAAWRDTGVVVEGAPVLRLVDGFEALWGGRLRRLRRRFRLARARKPHSALIRLNSSRRERKENYIDLLFRIVNATEKIWITNAYFVPDGSLVRALHAAAQGGVDVRIMVPRFSDVIFIPWVASAFHLGLLKAGVRIFEYQRSILHAKTMVIDGWGLVGSSNLNHRSLLHDLEVDVVVNTPEARGILEEHFLEDMKNSVEVTLETWSHRPYIERILGRSLLFFRRVL
jgi:cardiolipin synthase